MTFSVRFLFCFLTLWCFAPTDAFADASVYGVVHRVADPRVAKKLLDDRVYSRAELRETVLCECPFSASRVVDAEACGAVFEPGAELTHVVLYESVMPATAWSVFACLSEGPMLAGGRRPDGHTPHEFCLANDEIYRYAVSDGHGLLPFVGYLHGARRGRVFTRVRGEARDFGRCDVEVQGDFVEPPYSTRGEIARAALYMVDRYALVLESDVLRRYRAWSLLDPPSPEERARNELISTYQGNVNRFISEYPLYKLVSGDIYP